MREATPTVASAHTDHSCFTASKDPPLWRVFCCRSVPGKALPRSLLCNLRIECAAKSGIRSVCRSSARAVVLPDFLGARLRDSPQEAHLSTMPSLPPEFSDTFRVRAKLLMYKGFAHGKMSFEPDSSTSSPPVRTGARQVVAVRCYTAVAVRCGDKIGRIAGRLTTSIGAGFSAPGFLDGLQHRWV